MLMNEDEIINEVRKVRHAYAAKFNYDLDKIFRDIVKREKAQRGFRFVSRVSRKKRTVTTTAGK